MTFDWPALAIGLIVASYWARVVRLVMKMRRKHGASAHFVPPEPLGRALRILWYPTVGLWIVVPLIDAFVDAPWLRHLFGNWITETLGVVVAAAAFGATLVCWKKMGSSWRMGIDPGETTQLVTSGPFGFVRHPIYTLSSLLIIASVIAVPTWIMLGVALIHLTFLQWEARREERHLLDKHGDIYRGYMKGTGRFIPVSLTPYRGGE